MRKPTFMPYPLLHLHLKLQNHAQEENWTSVPVMNPFGRVIRKENGNGEDALKYFNILS